MKYILITGGVISGIGKGVVVSSIGVLLKRCGIPVSSIKIDPYINIDAGTFSPFEHGEVYVLNDGGEVDLDLGNYERFLDLTLNAQNNITTGKIYQEVINKERRGDYLGKTVQVIPHITDAIQSWIERVAQVPVDQDSEKTPQVCIIELGGTIGDIEGMPFVEALRQFQFRVGSRNFCSVHVSLVPQPNSTKEQKTKPTQQSVRELRGLGISPDIIICRSERPIGNSVKDKISNFCHVNTNKVICVPDCSTIYRVPLVIWEEGIVDLLFDILNIKLDNYTTKFNEMMTPWVELVDNVENLHNEIRIALVGKYTLLEDAYDSVKKSLQHATYATKRRLNLVFISASDLEETTKNEEPVKYHNAWKDLCQCKGIVIPGGFGIRGVEGKIVAAKWARTNNVPFLGICLGLQCAVIEFARNVLGHTQATSTEIEPETSQPLIVDMPEHVDGNLGGTMRLGKRRTIFTTEDSILRKLYNNRDFVDERHRHRYEVNSEYISELESKGMIFVGHDVDKVRMEIMEVKGHPYYVGVQYHPEYLSRPLKPSPPFVGLILASIGKLDQYLKGEYKIFGISA